MPKGHRSDQSGSKVRHIKSKAKHQKKKFIRSEDPVLAVFMWGVQHCINEVTTTTGPCLLLAEDFKAYSKIRVENQFFNKENLPGHFKFKDYCPWVFYDLRKKFGINDSIYLHSLVDFTPHPVENQGRSSSRFYYSHDEKMVMKSALPEEIDLLHQILPEYHAYVVTHEGKTFLPHFLGLYRLTVNSVESYWIVMRNVLNTSVRMHKKFDLKGSTVDRSASDKEKAKTAPTYKDNDFIENGEKICIGETAKDQFLAIIEQDVAFLESLNLMDYSLLVGIHDPSLPPEDEGSITGSGVGESSEVVSDKDGGKSEEDNSDNDDVPSSPVTPTARDDLVNSVEVLDSPPSPNGSSDDQTQEASKPSLHACSPEEEVQPLRSPGAAAVSFVLPSEQTGRHQFRSTPSERMFPVIANDVDVFAIPSAQGEKPCVYYVGIIDILTNYGAMKKAAHAAKTVKHGAGADISTVKPGQYARRFLDFLTKSIQ